MSGFLLLHADRSATLLADDPIVPANDVARFGEVTALLGAAATLREDARRASEAAADTARDEGFAAGRAEGLAAGEASIRDELLRLAQADAVRAEAQRGDLAKLALEVVRHIAGDIGAPDLVAALAAKAALAVAPESAATIRVHPDAAAATAGRITGLRHIAVESDATLDPEDCVVETALGRTHAGLETQITQLERTWGVDRVTLELVPSRSQGSGVDDLLASLERAVTVERRGRLVEVLGTTLKVTGIAARIGETCEIVEPASGESVIAEVVGIAGNATILTPLGDVRGLSPDAEVLVRGGEDRVAYGEALLGRVLDGRGRPIDNKGPIPAGLRRRALHAPAPQPMDRALIDRTMETGVRAIDTLLTLGEGQRIGVFAAAGGGKSTLLGMIARFASAEIIVIALIGERGREVREFIEDSLGEDGLKRSIIVCATSDRAAMERVRAAHHATAIAEGFRAEGKRVLLLMDSVTRFARALREIGLAAGEPAVRRGFPPSVFAELPRLFERAGNDAAGSITGIYTVLLEDEDGGDPVGEEVRSILDGHILLSRKLGSAGHYPAIDVLGSLSRLFPRLADPAHRAAATQVRALMAKHAEIEFLVQVGEYRAGADAVADRAIAAKPEIEALLRQDATTPSPMQSSLLLLRSVGG